MEISLFALVSAGLCWKGSIWPSASLKGDNEFCMNLGGKLNTWDTVQLVKQHSENTLLYDIICKTFQLAICGGYRYIHIIETSTKYFISFKARYIYQINSPVSVLYVFQLTECTS